MSPYAPTDPWPTMRGSPQNTGRARLPAVLRTDLGIRHFPTGNAVFSPPVMGAGDRIYVGSADHVMYAFDPIADRVLWKYDVGEIIDSASCLGPDGSVYVPSGSGLFAFNPDGTKRWHLDLVKQRTRFTPSTIYWFEGSVTMGPNGLLYAGCDDFHVYAIDPKDGSIRWAFLTGCNVWTTAAFGPGNMVYAASFDCMFYALDADTGALRWSRNMRNFVVCTPAVGPDGTVYFGSFDGAVYALDGRTGKTLWKYQTGGSIYASPTLSEDGKLYIGSADENFYCLDIATRSVDWAFSLRDCVRSSAALGVDPEGKEPYLLYVGGGDGVISVLDRHGRRRWSYNTLVRAPAGEQYCNINAAVALGEHGFSTASANGDVLYLPYNVYLTHPGHPGISRQADDGYPKEGSQLTVLSPGGVPEDIVDHKPLVVQSGDTVSLRVMRRENGRTMPARIQKRRTKIRKRLFFPHEKLVSPCGNQINIVPKLPVAAGTYALDVRVPYAVDGVQHEVSGTLQVKVEAPKDPPDIGELTGFRITHMSVYSPSIVPSFDQIAIASLVIDVRIVRYDPVSGRVVAWGVQKFGLDENGNTTVGIPVPRFFLFAFHGTYRNGSLILESKNCLFEITAFPVPLDRLRFTASLSDAGFTAGSMLAEVHFDGWFAQAWKHLLKDIQLPCFDEIVPTLLRSCKRFCGWVRSWYPHEFSWSALYGVLRSASKVLPLGWQILSDRVWHPWGLLDKDGYFCGVGTYKTGPLPSTHHDGLHVEQFRYDRWRRQVILTFRHDPSFACGTAVPGILIYHTRKMKVLAINYNEWTVVDRNSRGVPLKAVLTLPPTIRLRGSHLRAIAFVDLEPRGEIPIRQLPTLRRDSLRNWFTGARGW